jgi:hypothetical protein
VPEIDHLLACALRFEARLDDWAAHIDPGWRELQAVQCLTAVEDLTPQVRRRVALAVYRRWCGELPQPESLARPGWSLALCDREELLARLCSLALALRPGVLRCCVERRARESMRHALGDTFDRLRDQAQGGKPVNSAVTRREPLAWACVGYRDLVRAGSMRERSLRRCTRLSLPPRWSKSLAGADSPLTEPAHKPTQVLAALRRVVELRGGSPW